MQHRFKFKVFALSLMAMLWGSQMAVQAASHGWLASGQSLHCLGAARQIIPAAKNLESAVLPQEADISAAVRALLN